MCCFGVSFHVVFAKIPTTNGATKTVVIDSNTMLTWRLESIKPSSKAVKATANEVES